MYDRFGWKPLLAAHLVFSAVAYSLIPTATNVCDIDIKMVCYHKLLHCFEKDGIGLAVFRCILYVGLYRDNQLGYHSIDTIEALL